jgi:hypothetical protein
MIRPSSKSALLPKHILITFITGEGAAKGKTKIVSLNKLLVLNPPLKKEDIGGFALDRCGKIPPTPLCKGGNVIWGQALN